MKLIPKRQSAYQHGRVTSEQILAVKMLCEKALVTVDVPVYNKLNDFSKVFGNVCQHCLKNM